MVKKVIPYLMIPDNSNDSLILKEFMNVYNVTIN